MAETRRISTGEVIPADWSINITRQKYNKCLQKLAEYEGLEEQGKLIKLPCKVRDTVYTNIAKQGLYMRKNKRPYACKIVFIGLNGDYDNCYVNVIYENESMLSFKFADFGKTLFLTRQEAEAALEKMEGENEHNN